MTWMAAVMGAVHLGLFSWLNNAERRAPSISRSVADYRLACYVGDAVPNIVQPLYLGNLPMKVTAAVIEGAGHLLESVFFGVRIEKGDY